EADRSVAADAHGRARRAHRARAGRIPCTRHRRLRAAGAALRLPGDGRCRRGPALLALSGACGRHRPRRTHRCAGERHGPSLRPRPGTPRDGATARRACGRAGGPRVDRRRRHHRRRPGDGKVLRSSQIAGWTGLGLPETVSRWFDCDAVAGNAGTLAALGEKWQGAARYADDVALILSGRPSGQGIVLGGRAHHGRSGAAAELGRLLHDQTWNAAAVLEEAGRTAAEVFRASAEGEEEAVRLTEHLAHHTARAASVLVSVLDPELVVVAGELTVGGSLFLDAVRQQLETMCINVPAV